jgi:bifunctional UDP-N-acetylglucosamine pyrophosphorylase/glucosamine-1-phosphate N-acetyltransferase
MQEASIPTNEKTFAVVLDENVVVNAFNSISNDTQIGKKTIMESFNQIENTSIGENCVVKSSKIIKSIINDNVNIGPNAHLRPNSLIKSRAKIGNFVEVKNSVVGEDSKVSHMSYIGDGTIGNNCNIGCGTIFCNYDGKNKNKTIIDDNVFIGSNVNLVAPIHIGKNAIVAAGSTLTKDVEKDALAIARAYQVNKPNYKRKE